MSSANMTKMKQLGCPMDSVESVETWRKEHFNIAQRKPDVRPAAATHASVATHAAHQAPGQAFGRVGGDDFHAMIRAHEVRPDSGPLGEDFDSARKREKIAAADLAEMEADLMRGQYLVKEDFRRYLFNAGRMLRDTLTNCARRVSAEVAGLNSAEECEVVIDREHRAALASFSQTLRQTVKIEIDNPLNAPIEASP
jgi:hypothetical protein